MTRISVIVKLHFRFQTPPNAQALGESDLGVVALAESVDRLFASPHYRAPMIPAVALRVLELSRQPDVSFSDVVLVVESDPLLAASVLKLASSPVYASRTNVRSIDQALLRLGLQTLTDLCLEAAVSGRVFRSPGFARPMEEVRIHSVATAHIARLVAQRSSVSCDAAFTVALLHEIGTVAGLIALGTSALWPKAPPIVKAWPVLNQAKEVLTEKISAAWKLPRELSAMLKQAASSSTAVDEPSVMALVVADVVAVDLGIDLPDHGHNATRYEMARDYLGLRFSDLHGITADAKKMLPAFRAA